MTFEMPPKFHSLDEAIRVLYGDNIRIETTRRISGGDINEAFGLVLSDGNCIFMKSNARTRLSFFAAEAVGLTALARTETIGTPHILGYGTDNGRDCSFLLLDFIREGRRIADYWEIFGRQLAALHSADTSVYVEGSSFGFVEDNFIGSRGQSNRAGNRWIDFFRECRLEPQFQTAERYFSGGDRMRIMKLLDRLENFLVEPEHPSLLHGDLWSGNFMTGPDGRAWIIDPAVYVGHAEADLAMSELFGGFHPRFYAAYEEAAPLQPGYDKRRDLYNLYQLLNHLNMFGGSYLSAVRRIIGKYVS